nr:hypothetical protein [Candidatus Calescibacterium sp.]
MRKIFAVWMMLLFLLSGRGYTLSQDEWEFKFIVESFLTECMAGEHVDAVMQHVHPGSILSESVRRLYRERREVIEEIRQSIDELEDMGFLVHLTVECQR